MAPYGSSIDTEILERAKRINVLILDVDGVLTDGKITYADYGDELKSFDVQDGAGMVFWDQAGLKSAIITGRGSRLLKRRAKDMRIDAVIQKKPIKLPAYEELLKRWRLTDDEVCAIGDDLMEVPILRRVGLAVCVPSAVEEVKLVSHYITKHPAGNGAVREITELILKAKGLWDNVLQKYNAPSSPS